MARLALPAFLLATALAAPAHVAFYLVLGAIPALAAAALCYFGELADGTADEQAGALNVGLPALALLLAVLSAAVRGNALGSSVPALGSSAAVAALGLLVLQGAVWCSARLSRAAIVSILRTLT